MALPDLSLLKDFNEKVSRLERSGLAKKYADEVPQVLLKLDDMKVTHLGDGRLNFFGKLTSKVLDFNEDEVDAFVLTYRILTQHNDRLSISRLAAAYESAWMPEEAKARFLEARKYLNDTFDSAATMEFGSLQISIRDIIDVVIYGGLAHTNPAKQEIFKAWTSNPAISGS